MATTTFKYYEKFGMNSLQPAARGRAFTRLGKMYPNLLRRLYREELIKLYDEHGVKYVVTDEAIHVTALPKEKKGK